MTTTRDKLEEAAEHLEYLKKHTKLKPYVDGQEFGKIEFVQNDKEYEGYQGGDFWLPCERAQLLRYHVDRIPTMGEQLEPYTQHIKKRGTDKLKLQAGLKLSRGLVASLRILGFLETLCPMQEHGESRLVAWNAGKLSLLAPENEIQVH